MTALRVLHLVGSPTNDFFVDLSLLYARGCLGALDDPTRYEPHIAYVGPDGTWRFPSDLSQHALAAAAPMPFGAAVERIRAIAADIALPQLFCRAGMTTYRALLDLLGIPFVGNTAAVMALGANKAQSRAIVAAAGVRVPAAERLRAGQTATMTPPVVVKPVDADNSVGVTLVREQCDLPSAVESALEHSDEVLVERYVDLGREVRCGVLERGGELVVLPLEEYAVDARTKPIRGQDDKLARSTEGDLALVAKDASHAWIVDPSDPVTEVVAASARACHRALGCRHYSLFDFRIDPDGQPWFLEAGLYCSFAPSSVVAVMAAAAGITLDDLFDGVIGEVVSVIGSGPGRAPA